MSRSNYKPLLAIPYRIHPNFDAAGSLNDAFQRTELDPEQCAIVVVVEGGNRIGVKPEYYGLPLKEVLRKMEEDLKRNGKLNYEGKEYKLLNRGDGQPIDFGGFEIWNRRFVEESIARYFGKDHGVRSGASSSSSVAQNSAHSFADILRKFIDDVLEVHQEMVTSFGDGSKQYELEGICQIKKDQSGKCRITTYDDEGRAYNINIFRNGEIEVNYLGVDSPLSRDEVNSRIGHLPEMLGIKLNLADVLNPNPSPVVQANSSISRPLSGRIDPQSLQEQNVKNFINNLLIGHPVETSLEITSRNTSAIITRYENGKMSIKLSENGVNVGNINVLRSSNIELNQRGVDSGFEESRDEIFLIMTKVAIADGSSLEELANSDLAMQRR